MKCTCTWERTPARILVEDKTCKVHKQSKREARANANAEAIMLSVNWMMMMGFVFVIVGLIIDIFLRVNLVLYMLVGWIFGLIVGWRKARSEQAERQAKDK